VREFAFPTLLLETESTVTCGINYRLLQRAKGGVATVPWFTDAVPGMSRDTVQRSKE